MSYLGFMSWLAEKVREGKLRFERNRMLSTVSSFRIGGPADFIVWPYTAEALAELIVCMRDMSMRFAVFGNCSNVLFDDFGFRGCIVLTSQIKNVAFGEQSDGAVLVSAGAGESLTGLAARCADQSLTGLEFAYGIPGSVGGAVYMNAGAYGSSISDVLTGSRYIDAVSGEIRERPLVDHGFDYRKSVYMDADEVIVGASFLLKKGDQDAIRAEMDDLMQRRRDKQPLEYPSAGSVFKRYPGFFTAQLIDEAGLKGTSVGGAQVSEKHAGFIINRGGATAKDVLDLIELVKEKIYERNGIHIECEIRYIKP